MSIQAIKAVMGRHDLRGPIKAVALVMAEHAHQDGTETFPSVNLISLESGYCRSTVKRSIAQLIERGIITKTKGWTPRTSNTYRFLIISEGSEITLSPKSEGSQRTVRGFTDTPQRVQREPLTPREPLDNQLGRAENLSASQVDVSFAINRSKVQEARELLKAQRRARGRLSADS